jgi:hypothetical protein
VEANVRVEEQRLLPEAVARQPQAPLPTVVYGKRPLPHQSLECLLSPACPSQQQDLGVGARRQLGAVDAQLAPDVVVIVYLAVEGDEVPSVGAPHRLLARIGEVEDAEAAVAEGRRPVVFHASAVGAAALEAVRHRADKVGVVAIRVKAVNAGDATHDRGS